MDVTVRYTVGVKRQLRFRNPDVRRKLAGHARTLWENAVSADRRNTASTPLPTLSARWSRHRWPVLRPKTRSSHLVADCIALPCVLGQSRSKQLDCLRSRPGRLFAARTPTTSDRWPTLAAFQSPPATATGIPAPCRIVTPPILLSRGPHPGASVSAGASKSAVRRRVEEANGYEPTHAIRPRVTNRARPNRSAGGGPRSHANRIQQFQKAQTRRAHRHQIQTPTRRPALYQSTHRHRPPRPRREFRRSHQSCRSRAHTVGAR